MISADKLVHFIVGLMIGAAFWKLLEVTCPIGIRRINPIVFLVMLIWGASGLFFFRKLHIPLLSGDLFYMATPDWDIPLYNLTRLRFLLHRSWLFHSILIPAGLMALSWWQLSSDRPQRFWRGVMEAAIGLSVGMSAHLLWDGILSSTRRGFLIHGWSLPISLFWLIVNLLLGIALPFSMVWLLNISSSLTKRN